MASSLPSSDVGRPATRTVATVAIGAFLFVFLTAEFHNDHFGRISLGYNWLYYGDTPFRDYFDPGLFGAAAWSATGLALSGGRLLGELLLDSAAIAAGIGIAAALTARTYGTRAAGVVAAVLCLMAVPRLYDYDKVLCYPAGLLACWRYADAPRPGRAAVAGAVIAISGLLRFDSALYLGLAFFTAVIVSHGSRVTSACRDGAAALSAALVFVAPVAAWVHAQAGLAEAASQVVEYARIEGARTALFPPADVLSGVLGPAEAWHRLTQRGIGAAAIYVMAGLVPIAALRLAWTRTAPQLLPLGRAHVASAAVLCLCLTVFILRDPLTARIGAALPVIVIVWAWCLREVTREMLALRRQILALAVVSAVGFACVSTSRLPARLREAGFLAGPAGLARETASRMRLLAARPPALGLMPGDRTRPLVTYVRQCTREGRRVLATWFMPELYYFAQRPFAGGMVVFFGGHWSSAARQRRIVEWLRRDPPVLIIGNGQSGALAADYAEVARYVDEAYVLAARAGFEHLAAQDYTIYVPRTMRMEETDPIWGLPCPAGRAPASTAASPHTPGAPPTGPR